MLTTDLSPPTLYMGHTAIPFKSHLPVLQAIFIKVLEPLFHPPSYTSHSNLNCPTAVCIIATTDNICMCHGAHAYSIGGPTFIHELKAIIHFIVLSMYINGHTWKLY